MQESQKITFIDQNEYPLWDEFVRNSPQGSFFYTTTWADILKKTFNRDYKIAVCSRSGNWLAGTILFINRRLNRPLITPMPLQFFNAPIFYDPGEEKYQKTISNILEVSESFSHFFSKHFPVWMLSTPCDYPDLRAYLWVDCRVEPTYSYILALDKKADPADLYSQSVRRKLKQAGQYDPQVIQGDTAQHFIDLYQNSYRRHNLSAYLEELSLKNLLEKIQKLPQFKLYYIKFGQEIVAGRLICIDNTTVYDVLAGSSDESGTASVYLVDHIIRKHLNQFKIFDFMGADHRQIEQFKRGFGAHLSHGFKITGKMSLPFSLLYKSQEILLRRRRAL